MPTRYELPQDDERTALREGVVRALHAVPMHFVSTINVEGISTTDLFAMNTLLGGAIESQTVETLNATRAIWDPQGRWADYEFKRYAESFPDVRLESNDGGDPLIGIELKGWYLLAKEEEPSFRFKASANAMTVWDLIAVFPWSQMLFQENRFLKLRLLSKLNMPQICELNIGKTEVLQHSLLNTPIPILTRIHGPHTPISSMMTGAETLAELPVLLV